jgi:hypothetical protein
MTMSEFACLSNVIEEFAQWAVIAAVGNSM